jgi:hypothetical protein
MKKLLMYLFLATALVVPTAAWAVEAACCPDCPPGCPCCR